MSLQNRQFRDNIQGIGYNVPKEESQQLDESKLTLQEQKDPEMLMKMMSKMGGAPKGGAPEGGMPPMPKMGGGEGGMPKLDPEMLKKLMKMMQGGMMNAGTEHPTDSQLTEGIWDDILRFFSPDSPETAIDRLNRQQKEDDLSDDDKQDQIERGERNNDGTPNNLTRYESTQRPTDNQLIEGIWDDILRFFSPDSPETAIHRLEQERKRKEKERLQHRYDRQPTQGPSAIPSKYV